MQAARLFIVMRRILSKNVMLFIRSRRESAIDKSLFSWRRRNTRNKDTTIFFFFYSRVSGSPYFRFSWCFLVSIFCCTAFIWLIAFRADSWAASIRSWTMLASSSSRCNSRRFEWNRHEYNEHVTNLPGPSVFPIPSVSKHLVEILLFVSFWFLKTARRFE